MEIHRSLAKIESNYSNLVSLYTDLKSRVVTEFASKELVRGMEKRVNALEDAQKESSRQIRNLLISIVLLVCSGVVTFVINLSTKAVP